MGEQPGYNPSEDMEYPAITANIEINTAHPGGHQGSFEQDGVRYYTHDLLIRDLYEIDPGLREPLPGELEKDHLQRIAEQEAHNIMEVAHYGVPVPPTFGSVGLDPEAVEPTIILATREVVGTRLTERAITDVEPIIALIESLSRYLAEKVGAREAFLYDIFEPRQYILGTWDGQSVAQPWLVDVEPLKQDYAENAQLYMRFHQGAMAGLEKLENLVLARVTQEQQRRLDRAALLVADGTDLSFKAA